MKSFLPFNGDSFLHAEIARLVGKWGVKVAVETGTHVGHTTIALSLLCERTFTVEIDSGIFSKACDLFDRIEERGEIVAECGSSPGFLSEIRAEVCDERTLFYLDAHWGSHWPLLDELGAIAGYAGPKPIVVIHDAMVPGRADLGFDCYNGQVLTLKYVQPGLREIYGQEYHYFYNRLSIGASRGTLFVEPFA